MEMQIKMMKYHHIPTSIAKLEKKKKKKTTASAVKLQNNQNSHTLLMSMQNGIDTVYNFAVSYKVKHPLIIHQFYSQRKLMLTKFVYTSFIHNHQKLGLIQTYVNWQINCDIILQHNGIVLGFRENCDVTKK